MKDVDDKHIKMSVGAFDTPNANGVIYPKPASADYDGDTPSGQIFHPAMIAFNALGKLRDAEDFDTRLDVFAEVATYNRSKFKRLSKRRKKIFMAQVGRYHNSITGKLVHRSRKNEKHIAMTAMHMYSEQSHPPLDNFLKAWASLL